MLCRLARLCAGLGERRGQETCAELVVSFGTKPWQIVQGKLNVRFANTTLTTAHVLDANGMVVRDVPLTATAGGKQFQFPLDAMYVVVE